MRTRLFLLSALVAPLVAGAGVNPQNGNFYISYQDVAFGSGDNVLELKRTYNSFADGVGWFGYGWGSLFETRVVVLPEGTAAVRENGLGATSYYRPRGAADVQASVTRILDAARARGETLDVSARSTALAASEEERLRAIVRYDVRVSMPAGTALKGTGCPEALLERVAAGYRRVTCEGAVDHFDEQGRLRKRQDPQRSLEAAYLGDRPVRLGDGTGRTVSLEWNADGRLVAARGGERVVRYDYGARQDLVKASYSDGLFLDYEYDRDHNLTRVGYADTSSMRIVYGQGSVTTQVVERTGERADYAYSSDPERPGRYFTRITYTDTEGRTRTRELEFQDRWSETGVRTLAYVGRSGGHGAQEATVMDDKGRVIRKVGPGGREWQYVYHPHSGRLILAFEGARATHYHYDDAGDLVEAADSEGRSVGLRYDAAGGRIRSIVDASPGAAPQELAFRYDDKGKPVRIEVKGVGAIEVQYDAEGNVAKVESDKGAAMAMKVLKVFSDLRELVRVGGRDL